MMDLITKNKSLPCEKTIILTNNPAPFFTVLMDAISHWALMTSAAVAMSPLVMVGCFLFYL